MRVEPVRREELRHRHQHCRRRIDAGRQPRRLEVAAWLYPQPGAVPVAAHFSVERRIAEATFQTGGTEEQVVAYYLQTLRAQGYKVPEPGRNKLGTQFSGVNGGSVVTITVDPKPGYVEVRATALLGASTAA